jgi:hypothetical protein
MGRKLGDARMSRIWLTTTAGLRPVVSRVREWLDAPTNRRRGGLTQPRDGNGRSVNGACLVGREKQDRFG